MRRAVRDEWIAKTGAGVLLLGIALGAAAQPLKPAMSLLEREAYRTPLDEIVVTGRAPYWEQSAAPRWDKPKVDVPQQVTPPRMQVLPQYTRDERDEYDGIRDTQNPKPRMKLFEFKF